MFCYFLVRLICIILKSHAGCTACEVSHTNHFVCEIKSCLVLWRANSICQKQICLLFTNFCFLAFIIFLSAICYIHSISEITYACTHPHCAYPATSSFAVQHQVANAVSAWKDTMQINKRPWLKYRREIQRNREISTAHWSAWSQSLHRSTDRIIQVEVRQRLMFSLDISLPESMQTCFKKFRSICFSATTSTSRLFETSWNRTIGQRASARKLQSDGPKRIKCKRMVANIRVNECRSELLYRKSVVEMLKR